MARSSGLKDRFVKLKWVQAYPIARSKDLATHPMNAPPPRETSARSRGKWSLIYVKFEIQGLFSNLQVSVDGHHKKLTGSVKYTKLGFEERGFYGDNWIKPKKNKTNANVPGNTCY